MRHSSQRSLKEEEKDRLQIEEGDKRQGLTAADLKLGNCSINERKISMIENARRWILLWQQCILDGTSWSTRSSLFFPTRNHEQDRRGCSGIGSSRFLADLRLTTPDFKWERSITSGLRGLDLWPQASRLEVTAFICKNYLLKYLITFVILSLSYQWVTRRISDCWHHISYTSFGW